MWTQFVSQTDLQTVQPGQFVNLNWTQFVSQTDLHTVQPGQFVNLSWTQFVSQTDLQTVQPGQFVIAWPKNRLSLNFYFVNFLGNPGNMGWPKKFFIFKKKINASIILSYSISQNFFCWYAPLSTEKLTLKVDSVFSNIGFQTYYPKTTYIAIISLDFVKLCKILLLSYSTHILSFIWH